MKTYPGPFLLRPLQFLIKHTPCRRMEGADTHSYRPHEMEASNQLRTPVDSTAVRTK